MLRLGTLFLATLSLTATPNFNANAQETTGVPG